MEQALNKKLKLVNSLYDITVEISKSDISEDLTQFNKLAGYRQMILEELSTVNEKIKEKQLQLEKKDIEADLNNEINAVLKNVMDLDYKINQMLTDKKVEIRKKIADIDRDIELKRYAVDKSEVKEKGHFIEFRG